MEPLIGYGASRETTVTVVIESLIGESTDEQTSIPTNLCRIFGQFGFCRSGLELLTQLGDVDLDDLSAGHMYRVRHHGSVFFNSDYCPHPQHSKQESKRRWRRSMISLLSAWRNWQERSAAMRELRSLQAKDHEWDDIRVLEILTEAVTAVKRDDYGLAAALWEKSIAFNKREAEKSPLAISILIPLRRYDEAERIMLEWQKRKPADPQFGLGLVKVSAARGDRDATVRYAALLRKRFPGFLDGYTTGSSALRDMARFQEAEDIAEQGMRFFPDEVSIFMEHARIATMRENSEAALSRWTTVRTRFNHPSGYSGAARILIKSGHYAEADQLLEAGRLRHPMEDGVAREWAYCAQARGDVTEAIARWKRVADRFPLHMATVLAAGSALEALGAVAEAETVLCGAADRIRHDPRPLMDLGGWYLRRKNFAEAAQTFSQLRQAFPDNPAGYTGSAKALHGAGQFLEAEAVRNSVCPP
jgi:tetratricopeptide (TPR) repeat protein